MISLATFVVYFQDVCDAGYSHVFSQQYWPRKEKMNWADLWVIPVAYLLGAIPSSYIVARFKGGQDIRDEPDGKVSAATVYRRVGLLPFLMTVVMDMGKTALAVMITQWVKVPPEAVLIAGICAIAGHQWSVFIRFKGGLGATASGGVLFTVATFPSLIGAAMAGLLMWRTHNSTLSYVIGVLVAFLVIFLLQWAQVAPPLLFLEFPPSPLLVAYPVILLLMMALKALQIKYRSGITTKAK